MNKFPISITVDLSQTIISAYEFGYLEMNSSFEDALVMLFHFGYDCNLQLSSFLCSHAT